MLATYINDIKNFINDISINVYMYYQIISILNTIILSLH